jgi:hypothetical protein
MASDNAERRTVTRRTRIILVMAALAVCGSRWAAAQTATEWVVDNTTAIGGHLVKVVGAPRVVDTEVGRALEFNGISDGVFVEANPLEGLAQFTLEVLFWPAADGPAEQRFVHIEDVRDGGNRVLIETRMVGGGAWSLDTFLKEGTSSRPLLDRAITHPGNRWHVASLVYDGREMSHYVDGVRELSGHVAFGPLASGRTSLGVRQNLVYWFKGRIRALRVTPRALGSDALMRVPAAAGAVR